MFGRLVVSLDFRGFEEGNESFKVIIRDVHKGLGQGQIDVPESAVMVRAALTCFRHEFETCLQLEAIWSGEERNADWLVFAGSIDFPDNEAHWWGLIRGYGGYKELGSANSMA